ncbi:MAG: hypothetical protein AABZ44_03185 [Elusimicrobiota bacterium]
MKRLLFLTLGVVSIAMPYLRAQDQGSIAIEAKPKTDSIMLGAPLEITYTITLPQHMSLELSAWKPQATRWGDLTLWDFHIERPEGSTVTTLTVKLLAFKLGKLDIPDLRIPVKDNLDAQGDRVIKSPTIPIVVIDPTQGMAAPALKDIKAPKKPLYFWETKLGMSLAALALLAIAIALWRVLKRRQKARAAGLTARPLLPPEEEFLTALAELKTSDLLGIGKHRDFYFALSAHFHRYLDRRFNIATESLTSSETLKLLHASREELGVSLAALIPLKNAFEDIDLAKFAKYHASAAEHTKTLAALSDFVENNRPIVSPETQTAKETA